MSFNSSEIYPDDFAFVYLDLDNPDIAWLTYRGIINSPDIPSANPGNISWFLLDVVKRGLVSTLRREGSLEGYRLKEFPTLISRLKCIYAYPTLEMANRGNDGRGKFRKENLVAIAPATPNYKMESYDGNWITNFDSLPVGTARKYWRGETTKSPHMECLLSGRFMIYGTTVRRRAYETIRMKWPNSLAFLELSRLAAYFGSDLGSISPWLRRDGERVFVEGVIKYDEKEGLEVFRAALEERRRNPAFQINLQDLKPLFTPGPNPELDEKFCVPGDNLPKPALRQDKLAELNQFMELVLRRTIESEGRINKLQQAGSPDERSDIRGCVAAPET